MRSFQVLAATVPARLPSARVPVAARRAGETGMLDLTHPALDPAAADRAVRALLAETPGSWGVRVRAGDDALRTRLLPLLREAGPGCVVLVGALDAADDLGGWPAPVSAEARTLEEGRLLAERGAASVVAVGNEAGADAGDRPAFVLLQHLLAQLDVPVLVRGGIGRHSAAAARACGAAGVVLDAQLLLTREAGLSHRLRSALRLVDGGESSAETAALLARRLGDDPGTSVCDVASVGQDVALAARLADRFATVGRVVQELRRTAATHPRAAHEARLLGADSPWAAAHETRLPLVQGPMTRVSDQPAFADAVAGAGALPFLALALMPGRDVDDLLERTHARLGDRPWGVGILGFVPEEVRREQLAAITRHRPPYALVAGGTPEQAARLEAAGTTTYLHVPSPGLLAHFLESGARRFVLEGRECGGHVGPRSSFLLWDEQVDVLLDVPGRLADCDVLLAGGIHDARSAAAAAAAAGPLAAHGARVGLLMGTGYLFTAEIRATGAVTDLFQQTAVACGETTLLESGRGYLTRCAVTDVVPAFEVRRAELEAEGRSREEVLEALEEFNLGRLRVASKGLGHGSAGPVPVPEPEQRAEGLFMMGEVATLRTETVAVAELHRQVCEDGARVLAEAAPEAEAPAPAARRQCPVAVVGMSCLLPGARGLEEFWANILAGRDSVGEVPERRWPADRYFDPDPATPDRTYSRWGGFLDEVAFDPLEFGLPPTSLPHIEGMQLLALHAVRDALADAGLTPELLPRETTSVVLGAGGGVADLGQRYAVRAALTGLLADDDPALLDRLPSWSEDAFPGILVNVTAGRVANRFDLGGLNCTIDAACASSLAAVHLAVRELEAGSSDVVVAGGVDTMQNSFGYLAFAKTGALSPTGRCRPFDADADGIAISEGVAVVVLKRLEDARRDGDRVYAVLRGVGGSSDGRARGLTAPRPEGQMRALDRAYAAAGVCPSTVELVEAHGTGTVVGDRTEVETLRRVFEAAGADRQGCALGSVKSNIGHTKCAAGVVGLVKVAKALHHRVLPPTIGVTTPNPSVDFASSPFYVNTAARPWLRRADSPRRGAVSAFGFGGTNFHAVLEEGDPAPTGAVRWPAELLVLSGTAEEVRAALARVRDALAAEDRQPLDLPGLAAATLAAPARPGGRLAVVATSEEDLARKLTLAAGAMDRAEFRAPGVSWTADPGRPEVAFLYPGQGAQRAGMHRELAVHFPQVRRAVALARDLPDLAGLLYPAAALTEDERAAADRALTDTRVAQPALGVAAVAITDLLAELGIRPAATAGHSYGEYAALWAAGAMSAEDLLHVSAERGRHIAECAAGDNDPGSMLAVLAAPERVVELLRDCPETWPSNLNSPAQTVVSGTAAGLARAAEVLAAAGVDARPLRVAAAFHSPLVAAAAAALSATLRALALHPTDVPVFANSTGAVYPADPAAAADLLVEHLVRPVRFADEVRAMHAAGTTVFLEVGPGSTLTGLVDQTLDSLPHTALAVDGAGGGVAGLLHAVGALWTLGAPVDLAHLVDLRGAAPERVEDVLARALAPRSDWVVDGAGARRRGEQVSPPTVTVPPAPVAAPTNGVAPVPPPPSVTLGVPAAAAVDGGVLAEFQSMMGRFLEMEREVMLTWLADGAGPGPLPLPGPPIAAAPVVEAAPVEEPPAAPVVTDVPEEAAAKDVPVVEQLRLLIAERTGYPTELLTDDLDLEADLGIDSIKRTEVVAAFVRTRSPQERQRLTAATSGLRGLRTLTALAEPLAGALAPEPAPEAVPDPEPEPPTTWRVCPEPVPPAEGRPRLDGVRLTVSAPPAASTLTDRLAALASGLGAEVRRASGEADPEGDVLHLSVAGAEPGAAVADEVARVLSLTRGLGAGTRLLVLRTGGRGADPEAAALAGALQTVAAERPECHVRLVEDRGGADHEALLDHLLAPGLPAHVVCEGGAAHTPALRPYEGDAPSGEPLLDEGGVALLTGGARGITSLLADGLARRWHARIELAGTAPAPPDREDPRTAGVTDVRELRRLLLASVGSPAAAEQALRALLREREIRATLERLSGLGTPAAYHRVDVREAEAVARLVAAVSERHGRVDLVVHGAGVVADSLVGDKRPEDVRRVVDTKVAGALHLARALREGAAGCRGLVLMSSVAGWFGNPGQADYAAANRALDALAVRLDAEGPGRTVSLSWGPWDSPGMVTEQVRAGFAERGVPLVSPEAGVRAFLDVVAGAPTPSHLVVGDGPWSATGRLDRARELAGAGR